MKNELLTIIKQCVKETILLKESVDPYAPHELDGLFAFEYAYNNLNIGMPVNIVVQYENWTKGYEARRNGGFGPGYLKPELFRSKSGYQIDLKLKVHQVKLYNGKEILKPVEQSFDIQLSDTTHDMFHLLTTQMIKHVGYIRMPAEKEKRSEKVIFRWGLLYNKINEFLSSANEEEKEVYKSLLKKYKAKNVRDSVLHDENKIIKFLSELSNILKDIKENLEFTNFLDRFITDASKDPERAHPLTSFRNIARKSHFATYEKEDPFGHKEVIKTNEPEMARTFTSTLGGLPQYYIEEELGNEIFDLLSPAIINNRSIKLSEDKIKNSIVPNFIKEKYIDKINNQEERELLTQKLEEMKNKYAEIIMKFIPLYNKKLEQLNKRIVLRMEAQSD